MGGELYPSTTTVGPFSFGWRSEAVLFEKVMVQSKAKDSNICDFAVLKIKVTSSAAAGDLRLSDLPELGKDIKEEIAKFDSRTKARRRTPDANQMQLRSKQGRKK